MKLRALLLVLVSAFSMNVSAGKFVLLNEQEMQTVKASIAEGTASKATKKAYKRLIKEADKALNGPNYSVVDKSIIPPGATANDFVSISSKYWPNENSSTGFPWVKNGDTNPDTKSDKVDRQRIKDMAEAVLLLSQAYYFSDKDEYAKKAAVMLKVWFLANKTRMTPHLQFAQTIPGVDKRSSSGVMDGRLIPHNILDSISLIRNSGFWSERFDGVMNQWFAAYLQYLTGSKMGHNALKKNDRNGSWYLFQTSALAFYLGDDKVLKRQLKFAKGKLKDQFNGSGGLVKEITRSNSYTDSCFNLEGLTALAVVADKANKKFWDLPSKKKSAIGKGLQYMVPATVKGDWAHDAKDIDVVDCLDAFTRYAELSGSPEMKSVVSGMLTEISDKGKQSGDEKRALMRFGLYKPHLLN